MSKDNRTIINGLDRAGDVLAEMARREGEIAIFVYPGDDASRRFTVGDHLGKTPNRKWVSGAAETLPGAFLKFLANRADAQAEIDKEAADRAAFEAFRAQQAQVAA